jgi:hypothetical protein
VIEDCHKGGQDEGHQARPNGGANGRSHLFSKADRGVSRAAWGVAMWAGTLPSPSRATVID